MQNLYTRFHGKPKPRSLTTTQIRLPPAFSAGMRPRQMRITQYFKPAANSLTPRLPTPRPSVSTSNAKLASNRKHEDLNISGKSPEIDNLTSFSKASASQFTHHICRRCMQHFISENMLHRHLPHCSRSTKRWPPARNLTEERHPFLY